MLCVLFLSMCGCLKSITKGRLLSLFSWQHCWKEVPDVPTCFNQYYNLAFHTITHIVCVLILSMSGCLKTTTKDKLLSLFSWQHCWKEVPGVPTCFNQYYNLASHTITHVLCVFFLTMSGCLKSTKKDRFLSLFSWQIYFTLRVFIRTLLEGSPRCPHLL